MEVDILSDFDIFFFYGDNDLQTEIESDLLAGFIQPVRSMFYNRQDGAGVIENAPNTPSQSIYRSYEFVNWASWRNTKVGDGTNGTKERRAAVSQEHIKYSRDNRGNLDAEILYIPFFNFRKGQLLSIPITGGA